MGRTFITRSRINTSLVLLSLSLALHLFVHFDYQILIRGIKLPSHWHIQFYVLVCISYFISVLLALINRWHLGFIAIKFIALLIIGYPLGDSLGIETILLISIILETVYYLNFGTGIIVSCAIIAFTFVNQKPAISWGESFDKADNHQLLFFLFISILILFIASYLKRVSQRVKEMSQDLYRMDYAVKELSDINLGYQNYAASVEKESIENERKRISREMHDIIGYTLTNQLMIIQAVLSMNHPLPDKIKDLLLQSQKQTKEGMAQARSALHKLREFSPDSESGIKLIFKLIKTFEHVTGIKINVDFGNVPQNFGNEVEQAVYRLIQEGLTNAFRHGRATEISIVLSRSLGVLTVNIWDNGTGAVNIKEGIGLKGMRERIKVLNGSLETNSLGGGFSIKAKIPYHFEGDDNEAFIGR